MTGEKCCHLILVIENEDNIAMALKYVIEREGYLYARVINGSTAMEAIRTMQPTIVLMDVMLPERSGFDICRLVREDKSLNNIRIIIMTARGSAQQQANAKKVGADAFLAKPFELKQLRQILSDQTVFAGKNPDQTHDRLK